MIVKTPTYIGADGKPVSVKKIPMSTGKRKFKSKNLDPSKNEVSPFDRFVRSNQTGHREY